uniref:Uncharacterized protein n=1 Tax=Triticum urartu TaxID=4572 RepID=A0A8R7PIB9_TRIUA
MVLIAIGLIGSCADDQGGDRGSQGQDRVELGRHRQVHRGEARQGPPGQLQEDALRPAPRVRRQGQARQGQGLLQALRRRQEGTPPRLSPRPSPPKTPPRPRRRWPRSPRRPPPLAPSARRPRRRSWSPRPRSRRRPRPRRSRRPSAPRPPRRHARSPPPDLILSDIWS